METEDRLQGARWRWSLLASVVLLNICLPSLVLSYGVLLVYSVNLGLHPWLGFFTPTFYILTYSLTQCWCRDAADSWGGSVGYRVMASIGLLLVVASLMLCVFTPVNLHPFIYGILGGFGSSLMSAQVDAVIFDTYDSRLGIIRALCWTGQAVGQTIFPHIMTALVDSYEYYWSFLVLSAIILQTLPFILLLRVDDGIKQISYNKYNEMSKTYSVFKNGTANTHTYELQLQDLSQKCWKSPSDDNLHWTDDSIDENDDTTVTITPPPSPEEKRRNIFGVEILPEIPEESEEEEGSIKDVNMNNKKRLSIAIKRLSIMGDNFEGFIAKQIRRDSQTDTIKENEGYTELEVTYDNISPITEIHREKIFNSFSFRYQSAFTNLKRKLKVPPYRLYRIKRRLLFCAYKINDTFIKPLTRSLSCWKFYPALMLIFSKLSLTSVPLVLLPMISMQESMSISMTESNFLMSLFGFTWICFLLTSPWLSQTSKGNFKYVAVVGLLISTGACLVLSAANNHDTLSIGCVVGGFGYGAISSSWETAVQEFVGIRKWPKLHSTLETMSGFLLGVFILGLSFVIEKKNGYQICLVILAGVLSVVTMTWMILAAVSIYKNKIRSLRFRVCP